MANTVSPEVFVGKPKIVREKPSVLTLIFVEDDLVKLQEYLKGYHHEELEPDGSEAFLPEQQKQEASIYRH